MALTLSTLQETVELLEDENKSENFGQYMVNGFQNPIKTITPDYICNP